MARFQEEPAGIEVFSGTVWAGCKRTRRSTTGGYTCYGRHVLKTWCRTQAVVALSSAEAELYGMVKASAELLGMMALYRDVGCSISGQVWGDASAALGIIGRQGLGKLRHVDTQYLWVHE